MPRGCMATIAGPNCEQAVIASSRVPPLARHTYSVACPARVKDDLPHATLMVAHPACTATAWKQGEGLTNWQFQWPRRLA